MTGSEVAGRFETGQRLHPTSLFFTIGRNIRRWIVPGLLVWWLAQDSDWEIWLMAFFVPVTVWGIVEYMTFRYRFAPDEIVVTRGILHRNERHIPFARIQNVDLTQNPFHRMLGVADVRLETASRGEPEAEFKVLSMAAVEEMRARIFGGRAAAAEGDAGSAEAAPSGPLVRLDANELILLGLIANRGMALVLAALGLAYQFDLAGGLLAFGWLEPVFEDATLARILLLGLGLVVAAVLGLYILSIAWTFLRFWDFKLESAGDDLRLSCGLLTRLAATVPRHRIQFVSIHESPVHRLFGRVSVRIETAGSGDDEEKTVVSRKWFIPLLPQHDVPRVLDRVRPEVSLKGLEWQPLAARARARMIRRSVILTLAIGVICGLVVPPWGAGVIVPLLPVQAWGACRNARFSAWAWAREGIYFRSGAFTRKVSAALFEKVQAISLESSPFDRRWSMATVQVDTAGAGAAEHKVRVRCLDDRIAQDLRAQLTEKIASLDFRW